MAGYSEFNSFCEFKYLNKEELKLANNYICLQLNNRSIGYKYYYDMYSFITKCFIVLQQRQYTKLGEAVCNGKVINFLKDDEHINCSCGSVYFKVVF